jgi:hypothetical protein
MCRIKVAFNLTVKKDITEETEECQYNSIYKDELQYHLELEYFVYQDYFSLMLLLHFLSPSGINSGTYYKVYPHYFSLQDKMS